MIAVFQNEWRRYFRSVRGYLFTGLFVFLFGLFATVYHFYYGIGDFEVVLSFLAVGVALLLPLLTVPLFRKRAGEAELLLLLPLRKKQVILGKYLFAVSVIGAMGGIFALWALFLGYLTEVNLLAAFGSILGFLLLTHGMLLFYAFVAVTAKKSRTAFLVSYAVTVVLVILQRLANELTGIGRRILESVSVFGTFSAFGEGRLELRAMLLYLSLTAVFGVLFFHKTLGKENPTNGGGSVRRIVAILCVCAIVINGISFLLPAGTAALDMTVGKRYTVEERNRELLKSLDREVTLTVMNADGSDRALEAYLEILDGMSPWVKVRYAKGEDEAELLASAGLTAATTPTYTLVASTDKRAAYVDYIDLFYYVNTNANVVGFVNYYRAMSGISPTSDSMVQIGMNEYYTYYNLLGSGASYAEYFAALVQESVLYFEGDSIISLIEYAAADMIPREYVLTGNGEKDPKGTLLYELLATFGEDAYTPLDLTETGEIPADAASVLIFRPTEDYSAEEIGALRSYLERGGTVTVITDPTNLTATPALMALLSSYGMTPSGETVRQEITVEIPPEEGEDGEPTTSIEQSDTVGVQTNVKHPAFSSLAGETALAPTVTRGNALTLTQTEGITLTPLLTTSEKAYLGENKSETGAYTLAAAAESETGARLIWLTGGDTFAATLSEYTNGTLYAAYLLALTMKWTDLVYVPTVEMGEGRQYEGAYLTVSTKTATGVGIVTILVLPALLVGFGKSKVLDMHNNEYLLTFMRESVYAEIMHVISAFAGFVFPLLCLLIPGWAWLVRMSLPVAIVNFVLQVLPVMVQRYVRPQLMSVYLRNQKRAERCVAKSE